MVCCLQRDLPVGTHRSIRRSDEPGRHHLPNGGVEDTSPTIWPGRRDKNADEGIERIRYDLEGNIVETRSPTSTVYRFRHDAEGNLIEAEDERRTMRLGHARRRIVWQEDAGARTSFEWDTEGRLVGVVNERGDRFSIEVDELAAPARDRFDDASEVTSATPPAA